jgi:two-component system sensor histidine kinase/response regulator
MRMVVDRIAGSDSRTRGGFVPAVRTVMFALLGLLCLAGGSFSSMLSAEPLVAEVVPGTQHLNLNSFVEHLEDSSGRWTLTDVQQQPRADQFMRNDRERVFNAGFTASAYWYRLTLKDTAGISGSNGPWYIQVGFPLLDYVDIYLPAKEGLGTEGGWQTIQTGDQRPFASRPLKHRNFIFPIELAPGQTTTIYLRVQTKSAHVLPLAFSSAPTLFKSAQDELMVLGCYYGVMLALILYNIFGYLSVRDRSYVDYIFFVLFGGVLLSLSLNGLGVEYFWSDYPRWVNASTPFHISAALYWLLAFTKSFLRTRQYFPRMNFLLLGLQLLSVAGAVLAFAADYAVSVRLTLILGVIVALVAVIATAQALASGMKAARIYLVAWGVYAVFVILQIAQVSNLLPAHFITSYLAQIGTAAAALLLSLALADRINLERQERDHLIKERQRAELDSHTKSEFLAHMSHEIRTPMNAIIGFTDLAMRTDQESKRMGFLANIRVASQTLLTILNDILDLSKIEAGKLVLERKEFRLNLVMEKLGALFSQLAAEKNIELILSIPAELPPVVIGDAVRLEQILVNLVSNALKFTDKGEVEVGVTEDSTSPGRAVLRFSVRDAGIGLTAQQSARLFEPFVQADQSTTRKYGGTGLGLNICKQLVERMGGTIGVSSKLGVGSTFTFTVPFDVPARSGIEQEAEAVVPNMLRGLRTLVVDDSATARKVHDTMLRSLGLEPESAASGEEAVRKFTESPYQLVLMDWQMEGMDGMEAARQIRALPGGDTVPIIMATVHPRDELSRRMSQGLVNVALSKPVTPSDLFDTLVQLFDAPLDMGRMLPALSAMPGADKLRGARILLVEDNLLNQRLAAEILRGLGVEVDIANDGAEGVAAVGQQKYDAVLMDMQMPVMDGLEATRRIRDQPAFEYLPIIAITANVLPRDSDSCLDAGMNDFIPKPINPTHLIRVLGRWIGTPVDTGAARAPLQPSVMSQMSESPDPINVAEALQRLSGNRQLFLEMLEIFQTHHAGDSEKFNAALSGGDRKKAYQLVHTLKGVAANLTMPKLWSASQALQHALQNDNDDLPQQLRTEFELAFDAALKAVQPTIAELKRKGAR